jgi:Ca-activated chloride channel family protein
MSQGFRPANPSVELASPISADFGVDPQGVQNTLEVPDAEVIVAIKDSWSQNRKRADIVLVVDVSGSMEGEKLQMVKAGLESFLLRILPEDRVGLVTFANEAEVVVEPEALSDNRIALQTAIQEAFAEGGTALYDALVVAEEALRTLPPPEEERIRAIVLLSDGEDNESRITLDELEDTFYESGISIFPVAYGTDANMQALERIADFSRTIVVQGSTGDIAQIFENLSRYF